MPNSLQHYPGRRFGITVLLSILAFSAVCRSQTQDWPQFRGPGGDGRSGSLRLPVRWSETQNVRWKTAIHDRGHSSPVVLGGQIWLTTASADGRRMYALSLDAASGRIRQDRLVFENPEPQFCHPMNSYASPTPVIEPGRVYVHFGRYGTACLDTATARTLWERRDLLCDHWRGPGSSPILYGNLLILTFDGYDVQYLAALDKKTGRTVWKTDRSTDFGQEDGDLRKAFSTPVVIETGGRTQLISCGSHEAMAYDPLTGRELWKVNYQPGFTSTARPLFDRQLLYLFSGFGRSELLAVRPGGTGNVTASHVAWRSGQSIPQKPSAVLVNGMLLMVHDSGMASCIEASTGRTLWQERTGGQFSASALEAAGHVYFFDHEGTATVIAADKTFRRLAVNRLNEGCMASPAVSGKALILRTASFLYRLHE